MKKFIITSLLLGSFIGSFAQKTQGTIVDKGANTIAILAKPDANINYQVGNINLVFSIADQTISGGTNPTDAEITKVIDVANAKIDNGTIVNPAIANGRAYYTYLIFQNNGTDVSANWTANVDNPVATLTFPTNTYFSTMQLNDLTNAGGGSNGQMYWFIQFNTLNDITDYTTPFYGNGAVNSAGIQEQFVPLQEGTVPVKFIGFSATKKDNNNALLNWQITNENGNVASYEVERSINGVSFTKVNTIAPKNNGSTTNTYELTDNLSAAQSEGIVYYRIKQVDKDGKATYTDIRSVRLTAKGIAIGVYPNPVRDIANVTLDLIEDAAVTINVIDATGKDVKHININGVKGFNKQSISMSSLASGSYLLKVQAGNEVKILPVVKAK